MRERTWQKRLTVFLGIFLSFGMVGLPLISRLMSTQQAQATVAPTTTPAPTVPAPLDTSTILFDETHLQSSGIFIAAVPTGWTVTKEFSTDTQAYLTMQNPYALSVLEVRMLVPAEGVTIDTPEHLSAEFTDVWLRDSWQGYSSWREDTREIVDNQLVIDFSLTQLGQNYVARQVAYADGKFINVVRVVMPSNASDVMLYVLENEVASVKPVERYLDEPLSWNAYYDKTSNHIIRYPATWAVSDAGNGLPASITGDNVELRVESASAIDSSDAASSYVAGLRTGTEIQSVEDLEQYGLSAYRVSYLVPTLDGPTQSGIALIMLDDAGTAHVANALLTDVQDTDLNTVDLESADTAQNIRDVRGALDSFSLLSDIEQ